MLISYPIFYVLIILGTGATLAGIVLALERYFQRRALRKAVERRIAALAQRPIAPRPMRVLHSTADGAARAHVVDSDIPSAFAVDYPEGY